MVVLMLLRTVLASVILLSLATLPGTAQPSRRVVEVTAERFEFWPSEIEVTSGEEIEIRLTSEDTIHGFRIVGTGTNLSIPKRGKGNVVAVFRGDRPGRYTFECSRMCGAGHHFMRGEIVVRPQPAAGASR
jgi:cytochrome c oxidase subunit 2